MSSSLYWYYHLPLYTPKTKRVLKLGDLFLTVLLLSFLFFGVFYPLLKKWLVHFLLIRNKQFPSQINGIIFHIFHQIKVLRYQIKSLKITLTIVPLKYQNRPRMFTLMNYHAKKSSPIFLCILFYHFELRFFWCRPRGNNTVRTRKLCI